MGQALTKNCITQAQMLSKQLVYPTSAVLVAFWGCVMQFLIVQSFTHWLHSAQARSVTPIGLWYIWQGWSKLLPTLLVLWLTPKLDKNQWVLQILWHFAVSQFWGVCRTSSVVQGVMVLERVDMHTVSYTCRHWRCRYYSFDHEY